MKVINQDLNVSPSLFFDWYESFQKHSPGGFCKKGVLKVFTKLTGKHLCQSLFFNKIAGLELATSLKKRLAQVFFCGFCETIQNTFFHWTYPAPASVISVLITWTHTLTIVTTLIIERLVTCFSCLFIQTSSFLKSECHQETMFRSSHQRCSVKKCS